MGTVRNPRTCNKPEKFPSQGAVTLGAPARRGRNRPGGGQSPGVARGGRSSPARAAAPRTPSPAPARGSAIPNAPPESRQKDSYPSRRRLRHGCQSPLNSQAPPDTPRAACGSPGHLGPLLEVTTSAVLTQGALWECGPPRPRWAPAALPRSAAFPLRPRAAGG